MAKDAEPSVADQLAALERFIVENDDLLQLEALIGRFNVFDALGIARAEIRHSNFLAFILDPAESHGQGQLFLRAVLMDMLKAAPTKDRPFSPIAIDGTDLRGVEVRREWNDIDLLITCRAPAFILVLENKVDSGERYGQLTRYRRTVHKAYPGINKLHVFLTPTGAPASRPRWVAYSYRKLYQILARVRRTSANAIGDDVLVFLDHYLNLIGTRFMDDSQIDDLCRRIFKAHRQAIELIYERAGRPSQGIAAVVESLLRRDSKLHVFCRSGKKVDFVPVEWKAWLPNAGVETTMPQRWFVLRLEATRHGLEFSFVVRPTTDMEKRRAIIDAILLKATEFGLIKPKGTVNKSGKLVRLSVPERILEWKDEGALPEPTEVREAVAKKLDAVLPKLSGVHGLLYEELKLLGGSPTSAAG